MYSDLPEATELTVESGRADLYNTLSSTSFFCGIWAPLQTLTQEVVQTLKHPHRLTTKQADTPQLSPSTLSTRQPEVYSLRPRSSNTNA